MATPNEDSSSRSDPGLDGLPAAERKETEGILNELDGGAKPPVDPDKKPDEGKPADGKPDEGKENKDGKKEGEPDDGKKEPAARRQPKMLPAFIHETAKSQWEKREKDLLAEIETAKGNGVKKEGEGDGQRRPASPEFDTKVSEFAEKNGVTVEFARGILELAAERGGQLPDDIKKSFEEVKTFREEQAIAAESAAYNADFDKIVLPLIKAEYGQDVPPDVIESLRSKLKEKAYDQAFAAVPYEIIYRGDTAFREVIPPVKKGAEGGRSGSAGSSAGNDGDVDLSKPLSDEQIRGLSDKDFEKYMANMETSERAARQK